MKPVILTFKTCRGFFWELLKKRKVVTLLEFNEAFDWEKPRQTKKGALTGKVVLLLGDEVRSGLGVPPELILPTVLNGVTYRQLPHPSGLCRWYNDEANRELAALLLEEMYEEGRRTT